ncbi:hypothetical protein [Pseudomonas saxonica]|uniref:hypothetical protein n=1 Tax=Pseudomonas saxonica TaxID=2600598 RepID=UPI002D79F107|nr:hypothetical protein [Pseudomonas saxonica]WRQ75690.1 hypothetical protein VQY67_03230 [Pseudomonas saxonica]
MSTKLGAIQIEVDGSQKGVLKPKNDKDFLDINVSYIHHSITSIDKVITETMKMVVFTLRNKANVVLHEQVITFDPITSWHLLTCLKTGLSPS